MKFRVSNESGKIKLRTKLDTIGENKELKNSRVIKVLKNIENINDFRNNNIDEATFDKVLKECFPKGKGIWNIFIKHIAQPNNYPIYDQHVFRAFCWHKNESEKGIDKKYNEYKAYFFSIYGNSRNDFSLNTIRKMKELDNALMSFGKFLKGYGKRPTTVST